MAKRTRCLMTRRNFQLARRRTRSPAREEQLHRIYREAATDLSSAIKLAKTMAWQELLGDVDQDLWGRPYRIALRKLRSQAPPMTKSIES